MIGGGGDCPKLGKYVDAFGDVLANKTSKHSHRHNMLVRAWATAWRAAFAGVEVPTDDSDFNNYSRGAKPDLTARWAGLFRHHLLGEVKLVSPISTAQDADEDLPKHKRAMRYGLGGTEQEQKKKMIGLASKARNGNLTKKDCHYFYALNKGHQVSLMIHEVFGAWTQDAVELLYRMSEIREGRLDKEFHSACRTERSFSSYYATRISVALHVNMAIMIRQGVRDMTGDVTNSLSAKGGKRYQAKARRNNAG